MLFIETRTAKLSADGATRIQLLEKLQEKGLTPLIRSSRLHCYEQALLGPERVREMERAVSAWTETEEGALYTHGDIFCIEDFVLFLIFGGEEDELTGMRAGIIYGAETIEPQRKLDAFCRSVRDALDSARIGANVVDTAQDTGEWRRREAREHGVWSRFPVRSDQGNGGDALGGREGGGVERLLATEVLEDLGARRLLRRITEAQTDGRVSELLAGDEGRTTESLINRLADTGLLRREVLVSCRKDGRALFRLPSPDALSVITSSNARCSECGTAIADEKVEEMIAPTEMAAVMLEDGSWLINSLRSVLRRLGVPESQIAVAPTSGDGEAQMMVKVCDEPFLFVLREGDVTGAQARRALDKQIETEAAHLVVVAMGKIQEDGRVRLREHARRRARSGSEVEVILAEGMDAASTELQHAFERVSQRALAEELSELDASLGFSVGYMIATRFRLMQKPGALKDLAESAVGALAGSLREI
ncbi:MAG TPA: hypothetical protein VF708_16305 [Pyrinomonadaceae bacterium]|jgi:hypothetical protein